MQKRMDGAPGDGGYVMVEKGQFAEWVKLVGQHEQEIEGLMDLTVLLDEHPESYEGPCLCKLCISYGD